MIAITEQIDVPVSGKPTYDELVDALRPFANDAPDITSNMADDWEAQDSLLLRFTVGDLRRAFALISMIDT